MWAQQEIRLPAVPRGFHLITREVEQGVPELAELRVGIAHVFIRHTSASLTLNENASPDVRRDFAAWFDRAVPDGAPYFAHTLEGDDDMPAHIKASLLDSSLVLPVTNGRLALGTWQGIYLCEHRDRGGPRSLLVTVWGDERA
jgi:secondary thiamine-phosphate synthase enzyme